MGTHFQIQDPMTSNGFLRFHGMKAKCTYLHPGNHRATKRATRGRPEGDQKGDQRATQGSQKWSTGYPKAGQERRKRGHSHPAGAQAVQEARQGGVHFVRF